MIGKLNNITKHKLNLNEQFYEVKTGDRSLIIIFADSKIQKELKREEVLDDLSEYKLKKPEFWNAIQIR